MKNEVNRALVAKKKLFLALMAVAAIALTGCEKSKNEPENGSNKEYALIHSMGAPVTNPMNEQWSLAPNAKQTLSSLRRVSDRFYYMDFMTDLQWNWFEQQDFRTRKDYEKAFEDKYFTKEGQEESFDSEKPACSGFVCFNEEGEVLFGRNFDGTGGPLCMIFNKANGYKYIQFTAPNYNSKLYNPDVRHIPSADGVLSDGTTSLHRLMREPLATMDGMNEYGLCFGAFQLPVFSDLTNAELPIRVMQNEQGKKAISTSLMHNLILSQCKTVKEVETYLRNHNYVCLHPSLNVHWIIADATGDWALFEYWNDELTVYHDKDLAYITNYAGGRVPYEWFSIENYYRHWDAYTTFPAAAEPNNWQLSMTNKSRIMHMMSAYKPVMNEMEALMCLQEGNFGIEVLGNLTDWSCVYNPKQRTILFCMRNDMSTIYKVDLKKEL